MEQQQHHYHTMNMIQRADIALMKQHQQEVATLKAQRDELIKLCQTFAKWCPAIREEWLNQQAFEEFRQKHEDLKALIAAVEKEGK